MSENAGEKRFDATPSHLERAKREGNVARSQEACMVAAFAAALGATACAAAPLGDLFKIALAQAAQGRTPGAAYAAMLPWMLLPLGAGASAAAALAIVQSGGLHLVAVVPKFERLQPVEGLKRMFSRDALVTAARATLGFGVAGAAIVPAIFGVLDSALHGNVPAQIAGAAWHGALYVALAACAVGAAFAALDYGIQLANWRKKLRMSFDEMKRDARENDGDPLARSRRRSLHRQFSRGALHRVKDAAFVVTNPTRIAIALEYRPPDVPVPRVIVRAADDGAARVRAIAREYGVPLLENVPLARALYASARPGDFIAQEHYIAVAEIVAALAKTGAIG